MYYLINESCDGIKCSLILQPFSLKIFYAYTYTQSLSRTFYLAMYFKAEIKRCERNSIKPHLGI